MSTGAGWPATHVNEILECMGSQCNDISERVRLRCPHDAPKSASCRKLLALHNSCLCHCVSPPEYLELLECHKREKVSGKATSTQSCTTERDNVRGKLGLFVDHIVNKNSLSIMNQYQAEMATALGVCAEKVAAMESCLLQNKNDKALCRLQIQVT